MSDNDNVRVSSIVTVALAEFGALRDEIKERGSSAYTLLNINITAVTAIMGLVLTEKASPALLLILPLLSSALGMLFVDHSYNISNLGNYINTRLRPVISTAVGNTQVLTYEQFVKQYELNKLLRFLPLGLPLTLLFAGPPFASLVLYWPRLKETWAWSLWVAGVFMFIVFIALWLIFILAPYRHSGKSK